MLKLARTFAGLEITTRAEGFGRFAEAAFLTVWQAFWAVGEAVVLGLLIWGGWFLLAGEPPESGATPLRPGPALAIGLFLATWITFRIVGRLLAVRGQMRLMFGRSRLVAAPDALTAAAGVPPFVAQRTFARTDVRRFYVADCGPALSVETAGGIEELLRGPPRQRLLEAAAALNAEYGLAAEPAADGFLPRGWVAQVSPEGDPLVLRDPRDRRRQSQVLWGAAALLTAVAGVLAAETAAQPNLGVLAAILAAVAGCCAWGARRLGRRRLEWVVSRGRLTLQVRTGARTEPRFIAAALQFNQTTNSDGDPCYRLLALAEPGPVMMDAECDRGATHELATGGGDPAELAGFARWLTARTRLPLHDQTTP